MYLVLYLQLCFVLVSSNPLYEYNCCPNTYRNYGNDQPMIVQTSNYNPYPLSLLDHNSFNPVINSQIPQQGQYLNTNNFVPNYPFYNQNGLDIHQHFPENEAQKVINNYILIPQEYFQNNALDDKSVKNTREGTSIKNVIQNNKKNKNKKRRPKISNNIPDTSIPEAKTTKQKISKEQSDSTKVGRKKNKKKINKDDSNILTTDVEETLPSKTVKSHGEALIKNTNNHLISSCGKKVMETNALPSKKPNYQEPKTTKGSTKKVLNDYVPAVDIEPNKKDEAGFADVSLCFDINEDCTDLGCRHTRNKDVNKKNKPQSPKPQQDFSNNLNNYMNSLTYNQQMNPNYFNPNVNFPLNFDYLYQMPQTSNKPKEPNNRRRNRKRKQPSSNRQTNSNKKNKTSITIVDNCDKVVELTPEMPSIETTTIAPKTTTNSEEPKSKNVVQKEITLEKDPDSILENPKPTLTETLQTEVLNNDEISKKNNVLFENYNDVMDEYYPDFTLDNIYMSSKEDYDFGNFHDRYYYAYGDKSELNRERRKHEHPNDNNLNRHKKIDGKKHNKNIIQEPSQIQEIVCKTDTSKKKMEVLTPSALEFPGFRTEMINKDKYFAKEEHPRSINYDMNEIPTNKMSASSNYAVGKENHYKNDVETIFANSKVVRYGAPEKEEVISKVPEPEIKKEFKNLISNDGKTIVVIAKSLDYTY